MNKAFTRETDSDDDFDEVASEVVPAGKNYMTPQGYARMRAELMQLIDQERPQVVEKPSADTRRLGVAWHSIDLNPIRK